MLFLVFLWALSLLIMGTSSEFTFCAISFVMCVGSLVWSFITYYYYRESSDLMKENIKYKRDTELLKSRIDSITSEREILLKYLGKENNENK